MYECGFATCWAKEPSLQSGTTWSSTFPEKHNACHPCNFKFPNSHSFKTETGEINDLFYLTQYIQNTISISTHTKVTEIFYNFFHAKVSKLHVCFTFNSTLSIKCSCIQTGPVSRVHEPQVGPYMALQELDLTGGRWVGAGENNGHPERPGLLQMTQAQGRAAH